MNTQAAITLEHLVSFHTRQKIKLALYLLLLPGLFDMHLMWIFFISLSALIFLKLWDMFFLSVALKEESFLATYISTSQSPLRDFVLYRGVGSKILSRAGIPHSDIRALSLLPKNISAIKGRNLSEIARYLFESSTDIAAFFEQRGVTEEVLAVSAAWAEREFMEMLESHIPLHGISSSGIGQNLAFGEAYFSKRFGLSFKTLGVTFETENHDAEINSLISILNKSRESNAVLVGDDKLSLLSVLYTLHRSSGREMIILDTAGFITAFGEKSSFEQNFSKLLNEVGRSGNIILIIPDLPEFMDNARVIGSDVVSLVDPFLASSTLQVIATATRASFERRVEHEPVLLSRFEKVEVKDESSGSIERFAELRIKDLEKKEKVFFTAGALLAVRDSIMRFSSELLIDATDDLLRESIARAKGAKEKIITAHTVLERVEARTGVPQTSLSDNEKQKLNELEVTLGKRVVGQEPALRSVASALRRARAGVSSEKRPMGSFLFLGPTGVGKTETTKALSDIFFGTDAPLVRFDMSEYNSPSSLNRLIGTLESAGTLSSALREHEYGVLLLDEFEKTDKGVLDLFLQILDEGFFSDGNGKRVNVKNHIIIATSNAGSDVIFNLVKEGKDLQAEKDSIISTLIDRALFKPELLNRFDGIVLFQPLSLESLKAIAILLLGSLSNRLKKKGITLDMNDSLIDFLVHKGQDPKFGARPLNRAIQDTVESVVAKRLIDGTVKPGDTITLTDADLI
ncbi:MAG: hypothetical protein JWL80_356 [Parcubacteria group bacterium]|nr:hypothetical protein [Parcubacteria group bacterium]